MCCVSHSADKVSAALTPGEGDVASRGSGPLADGAAWLTSQAQWPVGGLPSQAAGAWLEEFITGPRLRQEAASALEQRGWLYASPSGATGWVIERGRGISLHEYRDLLPLPVSSTLRWRAYTSRPRDIVLAQTPSRADRTALPEVGSGTWTQGHPHVPSPQPGSPFRLSDLARLLDSLHDLDRIAHSSHSCGLRADTEPPSALYVQHLLRTATDLLEHYGALAPHSSRGVRSWLGLATESHAVDEATDVARMRLSRLLSAPHSVASTTTAPGAPARVHEKDLGSFDAPASPDELAAWTRIRKHGTWGWLVVPARSRWVRPEPPLTPTTDLHLRLDALASTVVHVPVGEAGAGVCVVPQLRVVGRGGAVSDSEVGLVNPVVGEAAAVAALGSLSNDDLHDLVLVWHRAQAVEGDPALWWEAHNAATRL